MPAFRLYSFFCSRYSARSALPAVAELLFPSVIEHFDLWPWSSNLT